MPPADTAALTHVWRIRKWLPDRYGQQCRVLAYGRMNQVLVEFEDGFRAVTLRWFVWRLKNERT